MLFVGKCRTFPSTNAIFYFVVHCVQSRNGLSDSRRLGFV